MLSYIANINTAQIIQAICKRKNILILNSQEGSGPFQSVEELTEVKGIGEGILAQVYDYVTVGGPDSPAE